MPFFHATVDHLADFGFSKFLANSSDFTFLKTVPGTGTFFRRLTGVPVHTQRYLQIWLASSLPNYLQNIFCVFLY